MRKRHVEVEKSQGNVFADLGLPEAEDRLVKAALARKTSEIITKQHLSQVEAAELLGIDQPKISALVRGRLTRFSLDRLMHFLNILGRDVQIVVKARPRARQRGTVVVVEFQEIAVAFDRDRLETALEDMAHPIVVAVETLGVNTIQLAHTAREVGLWGVSMRR
jgi:predicted XRE-type DNA-binding protein